MATEQGDQLKRTDLIIVEHISTRKTEMIKSNEQYHSGNIHNFTIIVYLALYSEKQLGLQLLFLMSLIG